MDAACAAAAPLAGAVEARLKPAVALAVLRRAGRLDCTQATRKVQVREVPVFCAHKKEANGGNAAVALSFCPSLLRGQAVGDTSPVVFGVVSPCMPSSLQAGRHPSE